MAAVWSPRRKVGMRRLVLASVVSASLCFSMTAASVTAEAAAPLFPTSFGCTVITIRGLGYVFIHSGIGCKKADELATWAYRHNEAPAGFHCDPPPRAAAPSCVSDQDPTKVFGWYREHFPKPKVYVKFGGLRQFRPRVLYSGNQAIGPLHWRSWGGSSAGATGVFPSNDCVPYCAAGHITNYPVKVRVSRIRLCGSTDFYTHLRYRLPRSAPGPSLTSYVLNCSGRIVKPRRNHPT